MKIITDVKLERGPALLSPTGALLGIPVTLSVTKQEAVIVKAWDGNVHDYRIELVGEPVMTKSEIAI